MAGWEQGRLERTGPDAYTAIGLLVILHDRDQRTPHRQAGTIQRMDKLSPLLAAFLKADVGAAGLIVAAVGTTGNSLFASEVILLINFY